jgi:hypothetical protein
MDGAGLVAQLADRLLATFNPKTTDLVEFFSARNSTPVSRWSSTPSTAVGSASMRAYSGSPTSGWPRLPCSSRVAEACV